MIIFPMNFHRTLKGVESLSILNQITEKNCLVKGGEISILALPEIAEKISVKCKSTEKKDIWMGNNKLALILIKE
jgi:hypothetical protein